MFYMVHYNFLPPTDIDQTERLDPAKPLNTGKTTIRSGPVHTPIRRYTTVRISLRLLSPIRGRLLMILPKASPIASPPTVTKTQTPLHRLLATPVWTVLWWSAYRSAQPLREPMRSTYSNVSRIRRIRELQHSIYIGQTNGGKATLNKPTDSSTLGWQWTCSGGLMSIWTLLATTGHISRPSSHLSDCLMCRGGLHLMKRCGPRKRSQTTYRNVFVLTTSVNYRSRGKIVDGWIWFI